MYICICMHVYVCMYMYICIYMYMYVYVCVCVCMCVCVCIHVYVCMHNILGGNCPGVIIRGRIVRGGIVLHPLRLLESENSTRCHSSEERSHFIPINYIKLNKNQYIHTV